ncbi:hypothetical protein MKK70_23355 [Methylobacterium sp. E-041]|uniref:hypothetical protein n=1 Tax=Methylobacterium sp. E-041 TaxID=2836573 RepID=UPI001FB9F162|nr:hypothetical protein [Methylobacterium sp. E-041]
MKFIDNADNGWGNDRNLDVHQVTLDGQTYAGDTAANTGGSNSLGVANLYSNGSATFHTGQNDTLVFKVSGDNWQGDVLGLTSSMRSRGGKRAADLLAVDRHDEVLVTLPVVARDLENQSVHSCAHRRSRV